MNLLSQLENVYSLRLKKGQKEQVRLYLDLLQRWNRRMGLSSVQREEEYLRFHLFESFWAAKIFLDPHTAVADIGSGAGFPGLVLAIICKDRQIPLKIKLIEKSSKKVKFLKNVIEELDLKVEVFNQNILEEEIKFVEDVFIARAFKPLKKILQLMHNNAENYKKIFIFLGKTGKNELLQASKSWDIEYKQRVSVTSSDSIVVEINKLKKK